MIDHSGRPDPISFYNQLNPGKLSGFLKKAYLLLALGFFKNKNA